MADTFHQLLQSCTKPKSAEEIRTFINARHGPSSTDNIGSDISALDEVALRALQAKLDDTVPPPLRA